MEGRSYRDMWIFCETANGQFVPVAMEMVGKARELMDKYNADYHADEKVVAVIVGPRSKALAEEAVARGADVCWVAEHPELERFRLSPYTRVVGDCALARGDRKPYDKPRYFMFPATNNGRDLSATIAGWLDTGLASDCNELYIEDVEIKHPFKTAGQPKLYERVFHMVRPDFSGFEHSTILCLDNPQREFSPQCCSVIPGSFRVHERDPNRRGTIHEIPVKLDADDLKVRIVERRKLDKGVDLTKYDVVVAAGRGIGDDPTKGIKVSLDLAKVLGAELGLSRGVITASYPVDGSVAQYVTEERQIGETGQRVTPKLYVALGISGAIQHKSGMDQSEFIVTINTDDDPPIKGFSDVYVKGDLFHVVPRLVKAIERQRGGA